MPPSASAKVMFETFPDVWPDELKEFKLTVSEVVAGQFKDGVAFLVKPVSAFQEKANCVPPHIFASALSANPEESRCGVVFHPDLAELLYETGWFHVALVRKDTGAAGSEWLPLEHTQTILNHFRKFPLNFGFHQLKLENSEAIHAPRLEEHPEIVGYTGNVRRWLLSLSKGHLESVFERLKSSNPTSHVRFRNIHREFHSRQTELTIAYNAWCNDENHASQLREWETKVRPTFGWYSSILSQLRETKGPDYERFVEPLEELLEKGTTDKPFGLLPEQKAWLPLEFGIAEEVDIQKRMDVFDYSYFLVRPHKSLMEESCKEDKPPYELAEAISETEDGKDWGVTTHLELANVLQQTGSFTVIAIKPAKALAEEFLKFLQEGLKDYLDQFPLLFGWAGVELVGLKSPRYKLDGDAIGATRNVIRWLSCVPPDKPEIQAAPHSEFPLALFQKGQGWQSKIKMKFRKHLKDNPSHEVAYKEFLDLYSAAPEEVNKLCVVIGKSDDEIDRKAMDTIREFLYEGETTGDLKIAFDHVRRRCKAKQLEI